MINSIELRALAQSLNTGSQAPDPCSDWDEISLRDIAARLCNLAADMEELADDKAAERVRAVTQGLSRAVVRHWHWRSIAGGFINPRAFASRLQASLAMDPDDPDNWRLVSCGQTTCRVLPAVLARS